MALTDEERAASRARFLAAADAARAVLKPGDRIRASRGCGPKATYTFAGWDGPWIVSRSGINDIAASSIVAVNGRPVIFGPGAR